MHLHLCTSALDVSWTVDFCGCDQIATVPTWEWDSQTEQNEKSTESVAGHTLLALQNEACANSVSGQPAGAEEQSGKHSHVGNQP